MPHKGRAVMRCFGMAVALGLAGTAVRGEDINVPAAATAKPAAATPVTVLDTRSVWHSCSVLKLPLIQLDDGLKPMRTNVSWLNHDGELPPATWKNPDFDDGSWLRGPIPETCQAPLVGRLYLRGQFEVTDLARAGELRLTISYRGGVLVYLNGQEIARGHLPKGAAVGPTTVAEAYPLAAYALPDGKLVPGDWRADAYPQNLALRERVLTDVVVPRELLREGVNTLAVEAIPAPYHKVVDQTGRPDFKPRNQVQREFGSPYVLRWPTIGIGDVRLTAAGAEGLLANAGRPSGVRVWNSDVLSLDYDTSIPDRCEPLRPVVITAARNGWFSGKVVLGSSTAVKNLKVAAGDLQQGGATIPAAEVRIRYAAPGGNLTGMLDDYRYGSILRTRHAALGGNFIDNSAHQGATQLGYLLESPAAEFSVGQAGGGTVVPIWITVHVPKQARPGAYTGQVTVTLDGSNPIAVPVKLDVSDWSLPDTQDYRTWVELIESPDTLVQEYHLDLWSDEHFQLIARAMDFLGEVGSRVVYVPLICHTNFGNEQSMVRWIRQSDDAYEWDFSVMDRYLDVAEQHMGKPKIVVFIAWDSYVTPGADYYNDAWWNKLSEEQRKNDFFLVLKQRGDRIRATQAKYGVSPEVSLLDPATKTIEPGHLYAYADPRGKAVWKSLFAELRKRLAARGLEKAMMVGVVCDTWPTNEQVAAINEASGNLPWVVHSHGGGGPKPLGYAANVFHVNYLADSPKDRVYGWQRPELVVEYRRNEDLNVWPAATLRSYLELNITGTQRGAGRIGADFWPVFRDKRGQRTGRVWERYPQSQWRNLDLFSYLLAPGPAGPVATNRYEFLREGLEECEARIVLERALTDESLKAKLGPDLAQRCEALLEERSRAMIAGVACLNVGGLRVITQPTTYCLNQPAGNAWFLSSGWQARRARLFALAGEVAAKTGGKAGQ